MNASDQQPRWSLADVAAAVRGRVVGDATLQVSGIGPVDQATEDELALFASRRYASAVASSRAGAFLVSEALEAAIPVGASAVLVPDARAALAELLPLLVSEPEPTPVVHPTAVLGRGVELGVGVSIGPYVVLGEDVRVGSGTRIGPHCALGRGTSVGADCRLHPHVVTYEETSIGEGVIVHSGARLGSDGFGYAVVDGEHRKIPQIGRCVIGDGVEIGANATIDRGSLGDTRVEAGTKLDNLVHIGHNVRVGARSLLAALVGIAGSTRLGQRTWMGGQSGAVDHVEIGDGARVAVQAGVTRDVRAGETVSGFPARPHRGELRRLAELGRISRLRARVAELEAEVEQLKRR